jgi:hypothetical protein
VKPFEEEGLGLSVWRCCRGGALACRTISPLALLVEDLIRLPLASGIVLNSFEELAFMSALSLAWTPFATCSLAALIQLKIFRSASESLVDFAGFEDLLGGGKLAVLVLGLS